MPKDAGAIPVGDEYQSTPTLEFRMVREPRGWITCGCSSAVECLLAMQNVEGSIPFTRSNIVWKEGEPFQLAKGSGSPARPAYRSFGCGLGIQIRWKNHGPPAWCQVLVDLRV